ncbi:hypothetical protein CAPTEDRAFT_228449 [Capitella teleta]|uniref:Secernin-2 n=1 Tax=Capitella teleta TaxID=283909 RepID=R7TIV1_CAPTE|nr:hypothetical protein CAPTEDRAFT_228449 [Capitella teleta]|eukprot:ELT93402.1 hypothetical protein CAPTEDRAFT_228449 [Capitella teleta]
MTSPVSCDTFVALPPATADGCVVFGKNSDRPDDEVQEVVYFPAADHDAGSKVQCTYIEIEQVGHTHAVMLSRPSWLWGAEMGSNEHGVCIGNEAVWTKVTSPREEKLLGMDLIRLALERSTTAKGAVDVITALLAEVGQGGSLLDDPAPSDNAHGHVAFLICDPVEAWVLETSDQCWAAERVSNGVRNISNQLTITTKIDAMSPGLKEYAQSKGWWNPDEGEFNFSKAFSDYYEEPQAKQNLSTALGVRSLNLCVDQFSAESMMKILRDERSGICMEGGGFTSTGSQVSVLSPNGAPGCHWFTATPNPRLSLFKPFIFTPNSSIGTQTQSPDFGAEDPRCQTPRFQRKVDRRHPLWKAHAKLMELIEKGESKGEMTLQQMLQMEAHCLEDIKELIKNFDAKASSKVQDIFQHMVDIEINFYK